MKLHVVIPFLVTAASAVQATMSLGERINRSSKLSKARSLFAKHIQESSKATDDARYLFEKTAELRKEWNLQQQQQMLGRRLQADNGMAADNSCSLPKVFTSECTLEEYCAEINSGDPTVEISCSGDVGGLWDMVSSSQETCIYFSLGEQDTPLPYRDDKFDPATDVCFQIVGTLTFDTVTPTAFTASYEFVRPVTGVFKEYSALIACPDAPKEEQFTAGYCQSCTSAEINGEFCNSCSPCPDDSSGFHLLDCTNIAPQMKTTCDNEDDDVLVPFGEYIGAVCTYNALVAGSCTLEKFCDLFEVAEDGIEDLVCSGDVSSQWFVKLDYEEECYYNVTNVDEEASIFDQDKFDASAGAYCTKTSIQIDFQGAMGLTETYTETFTRPTESSGIISVVSDLVPCDLEESDYDFGGGICSEECGDLSIGGEECTSGCKTCPDESLVFTCTNLDSSLEESCDDSMDVVTPALLAYFEKKNAEVEDVPEDSPADSPTDESPSESTTESPPADDTETPPISAEPAATDSSPANDIARESTSAAAKDIFVLFHTALFVVLAYLF